MTAYDIIKKPIITEKSEILRREFNKFTFEVNKKANKIEIRKAIETIFNRHGQKLYMTQAKKKAVVTLAEGNVITYFETV